MASLTLTAGLSLALLSSTDGAVACDNGFTHRVNRRVGLVAGGETLLNRGKPEQAAKQVLGAFPTLKRAIPGRARITDRGLFVLATALVRLDGRLDATGFRTQPDGQRSDNLRWSAHVLQALHLRRRDDSALETNLAEAWSKDPKTEAAALTTSSTLEAEDRVASPQGYSALARLRRNLAKESPSWLRAPLRTLAEGQATLAEARCRKMSRDAKYCAATPVAG
jgi:hypothetical protein